MSNKTQQPDFDPSFDPTIPEDGVELQDSDRELQELYSRHLPSRDEISVAARAAFASVLSEQAVQRLTHSSVEINESVRRIMHEHMNLGFRFAEIVRTVQDEYILEFGDNRKTTARAASDALSYIERLHLISISKIRLHIGAYNKFHDNADAVEFLRLTDMQYLLGRDVGDDIVDAIIEKRKGDPEMSTRAVKELIAVLRQKDDEHKADKEQLESVNEEFAGLLERHNSLNAEVKRMTEQMDRMRHDHTSAQDSHSRLRTELSLVTNTSSTLNQQLQDVERERDQLQNEMKELRARPPVKADDRLAKEEAKERDDHLMRLIQQSRELDEEIEKKVARKTEITRLLDESESKLEAGRKLEAEMNGLLKDFSNISERYHTAQLLCTAEGNPKRFQGIFQALADLVGKFHGELVAAAQMS